MPDDAGQVVGEIDRVVYHNQESNWGVFAISDGSTVVGSMMRPQFGVAYTFRGKWIENEKYGQQLEIASFSTKMPTQPTVIEAYLRENAKWIGPAVAKAIVRRFGSSALEVCKSDPELVAGEINGLTEARANEIAEMLHGVEADETLDLQLKELFLNIPVQKRALNQIKKLWRGDAVVIIKENPYILMDNINGIGFATADLVGQRIGIKPNDPRRLRGGIFHTMKEAANKQGHVCLPVTALYSTAQPLLSASRTVLEPIVKAMVGKLELRQRNDHIYLPALYEAEVYVANKLAQMLATTPSAVIPALEGLALDQVDAMRKIVGSPVSILTGAPGTGKSFVTKRLNETFGKDAKVAFCAPTGKAAKRITEHTGGLPAKTIHKLLDPQPTTKGGKLCFEFSYNEEEPLPHSVIVVDEMSMVDIRLFASLLKAVRIGARLILIGDVHQLPSVGPGNVLRDMIASGKIPCAELTTIKRQQPGLIIINSHRIKDGKHIEVKNDDPDGDFYWVGRKNPDQIRDAIIDIVKRRVPEAYGYDPLKDVQVISPFREKTILSVKALNEALQDKLNPEEPNIGKSRFRVGDKVIQKKNDYQRGIINGDIGIVLGPDEKVKNAIGVAFDSPERIVVLPLYDNNLHLAYSITCVSGDSMIWTDDGLQTVDEVASRVPAGSSAPCKKSIGTHEGVKPLTRIISRGKKKTIKIRTKRGYELTASLDHRLLMSKKGSAGEEWRRAGKVKIGDRIPLPRGLFQGGRGPVFTDKFKPFSDRKSRRPANIPGCIGSSLAELMGALVADGNYTDEVDKRVELSKGDVWCDRIARLSRSLFGIQVRNWTDAKHGNIRRMYFHNATVREFLLWAGMGYNKSHEKLVPWSILASPPSVRARFVNGLFSGDGSFTNGRIVFSTSSEALSRQVHLILLDLGIVSTLASCAQGGKGTYDLHRVEICGGHDLSLFMREVGFSLKSKRLKTEEYLASLTRQKTDSDNMPNGHIEVKRLRLALRARDGRNYKASREVKSILSRVISGASKLNYYHLEAIIGGTEDFDSLGDVARPWRAWQKNKWYYDEVDSVSLGEENVYDFTVDDVHAYISSGFISHNCHSYQGSEAPCIILPMHRSFGTVLMQRNWVYTAITRAKSLCIVVGQLDVIRKAIRRNDHLKRHAMLEGLLVNGYEKRATTVHGGR